MKMAAPPGWTRRPRQFTLPSVAGQIKGRPAMFRFRRGKATTSASRSTTIAGGSRSPDSPPLPYHESCPRDAAYGRSDHARSLVRGWPGRSPRRRAKARMVRSSRLRLIRPGRSLRTISVRNHDRSASRLVSRDGNGSLMRVSGQGRQQIGRLAGIEGSGRIVSTSNRTSRLFALAAALLLTVMGTPPAAAQTMEEARAAYARGDHATALRGFRIHAERGDAEAQFILGIMYDDGEGVPPDYAEAVLWYRRAAEKGLVVAQFMLGLMYAEGEDVPQDYAEAVRWYRRAAEQDNADAQFKLGVGYDNGYGVPQDLVQAHKWYNLAASRASGVDQDLREKAVRSRDRIAARLTPAQLAEAQRLAREWQPRTSTAEPPVHEQRPSTSAAPAPRAPNAG